MKKLLFIILLLAISVGTMIASDTQVNGIWYNFDDDNLTASVTFQGIYSHSYYDEYSGEVSIPSHVEYNNVTYTVISIGYSAFSSCANLTSIEIPNSVTNIDADAFNGCENLTAIDIPNSVTTIGSGAFSHCDKFINVVIPNSVISIGDGAFNWCSYLSNVTIGSDVISIGSQAFAGCSFLTAINIASDNPNYCSIDGVLYNKEQTELIQYPGGKQGAYMIPNGVYKIKDYAFENCSGLTSIEIPNSVAYIGVYSFSGCDGLTSIEIPNCVTSIGKYAFFECFNLTSINVSTDNLSYCSEDGILYNKEKTKLIQCPGGKQGEVIIPTNVTNIEGYAFYRCSKLTDLEIPSSVTSIGTYAFYWCFNIESIRNYASTPQVINEDVFGQVNLSSCSLSVPYKSVELYSSAEVWQEFGSITAIPGTEIEYYYINYLNNDNEKIHSEQVGLTVPIAPKIEGFTFIRWDVLAGQLANGINIQAIYTANVPTSAPEVYTNPANSAQKLIRNGSIYILTDDSRTYTITGQRVR